MENISKNELKKIFSFAEKTNLISYCREYPALTWNNEEISLNSIKKELEKSFKSQKEKNGLYIHIPFCPSRCIFCRYYSEVSLDGSVFSEYLKGLDKELNFYGIDFKSKKLDNIFFGGGTPTMIPDNLIEEYVKMLHKYFKINNNNQFSIEGTPETVKESNMSIWKKMGVNRISVGIQSFNDVVLKKIGRNHNVDDVYKAFSIIRKVGIQYVGVDLLLGLPLETYSSYMKTIDETIKISPDFIECYLLRSGGRTKIDLDESQNDLLNKVIENLKYKLFDNGYRLYLTGNYLGFVKKDVLTKNAMNRNTDGVFTYNSNCFGIGAGSTSTFPELKYNITSNVKKYIDLLLVENKPAKYFGFHVSDDDYKRQYIISQCGVFRKLEKIKYKKIFGNDIFNDYREEIDKSIKDGYITNNKDYLTWNINEDLMGHKIFYWYIIKYWYRPQYIKGIIKKHKL